MAGNNYSIKKNRINKGLLSGFTMEGETKLIADTSVGIHTLFLRPIDGVTEDATWGRLWMNLELDPDMVCYIHAVALNETFFYRKTLKTKIEDFLTDPLEPREIKREFFEKTGALKFVNTEDVLLYKLKGRYLYIAIEVLGDGACSIDNIRVDTLGDQFITVLPEIYRERDTFFHRFLSVFSSIYNDFGEAIDHLPDLLDLDKCPVFLLPVYGSWMGVDIGSELFDEDVLRTLVKEAYSLCRIKGTKAAIQRIAEIILKEKVKVVEHNVAMERMGKESREIFEDHVLFKNSHPQHCDREVTITTTAHMSAATKRRLMYILDQFKPFRTNIYVVEFEEGGFLDSFNMLDVNARICDTAPASLDEGIKTDRGFMLG